ncbi:MAG: heme ABC transporter permease [Pseudomonadales bacterium]|nr:heme ABC transporter permease [Pseudomonadales bacterium]
MKSVWDAIVRLYHKFGSPKYFYQLSGQLIPWFLGLTLITLVPGIVWGLGFAPIDEEQGHSYRIIFIHVPAASVAMGGYVMMAVASAIGLVWKMKMADMVAKAIAPVGASFAFLCLVTGSLWGKPTWGTWWVWDARLTSMLVLLFLYVGFIALQNAIENPSAAAKASGILAIVGVVNLPIIKYSVNWWNTLHQPATIKITESSTMDSSMLYPLLLSILGFYMFFAWLVLSSTRNEVLAREQRSRWVKEEVTG